MKNIIDKLAILNLAEGSDIIEEAKLIEPDNKINSIKIIRSEPQAIIKVKCSTSETNEAVFIQNSSDLFFDCKTITSATVDRQTSLLLEYTTEV